MTDLFVETGMLVDELLDAIDNSADKVVAYDLASTIRANVALLQKLATVDQDGVDEAMKRRQGLL